MGAPAATVTDVNAWTYFVLSGVNSPGTIPRGGIRGFKRETGWDKKKGKGTQGATLTLSTVPPVEGEITLQLIGPGGFYADGTPSTDFAQWDAFVAAVLSISPTQQQASGLAFYYPGISCIGLTVVVVEDYSPLLHVGRGLYQTTVKLCEWQQPPPVSIVKSVAAQAPDKDDPDTTKPVDPRILALQAQIAAAQAANQP
jgi:hypothetical protein